MKTPILFCNIGWMERYQGQSAGDKISGSGSYVSERGMGHEICNFAIANGRAFGYVQPPGAQINLERLHASPTAQVMEGVTVIWTATRPKPAGGTTIVGWYNNATVYKRYQRHKLTPELHRQNGLDGYWIDAAESDVYLLPIDARTFDIPRQVQGGMGQSNIWFADSAAAQEVLENARRYVQAKGESPQPPAFSAPHTTDQERKVKVEQAAIKTCCQHYEKLGYTVSSVEKDNLGWDLVATLPRSSLRIEVKGLSGTNFSVELTPNEFLAFDTKAADYRLAVVTDALGSPSLSICRFSQEASRWVIEGEDKRGVEIYLKQSALIRSFLAET